LPARATGPKPSAVIVCWSCRVAVISICVADVLPAFRYQSPPGISKVSPGLGERCRRVQPPGVSVNSAASARRGGDPPVTFV